MTKTLKTLPALLLAFGLANHASADTDWSLNVTFSDGGSAQGTFVTNTAGGALESWNIQVTGGLAVHDFLSESTNGVSTSDNFGSVTTVPNPVSWPSGTEEALEFGDFGANTYAVFYLGEPLNKDPIPIVGALDCGASSSCGTFKSGSIVDPPSVPEPVSIILLGSVVVFVSCAMRRRTRKN